jgi:hypothetical protein
MHCHPCDQSSYIRRTVGGLMFEINVRVGRLGKIWLGGIMSISFVWKWRTRMAYHMKSGEKVMEVWNTRKSKLIVFLKNWDYFTLLFSVIKLSGVVDLHTISNGAAFEFLLCSSICFNLETFSFHWKYYTSPIHL